MIDTYDIPDAMSQSSLNSYVNSYSAQMRISDLHAEAENARLAQQYRQAHPELGIRYRAAVALRRIADRIAPQHPAAPRPHVVRS